jgi:carboxyl-terminal processing protease
MIFIAGTQSFGKGSVQEVIPISNNCAVKITTSLYFLPFDTPIQGVGIKPDFAIEKWSPPTDQVIWFKNHFGHERVLSHSIKAGADDKEDTKKEKENKKAKAAKEKSWADRAKETLSKDNQLREVISLINIFDSACIHCKEKVSNRTKAVDYLNALYITDNELKLIEIKI